MYYGDFNSAKNVFDRYSVSDEDQSGVQIIAATYTYEDYSGNSFVVFRKDGKLFEVHGSHCSCNGLEGQWEPHETSFDALMDRFEKAGDYQNDSYGGEFVEGLKRGLFYEVFEKDVLNS